MHERRIPVKEVTKCVLLGSQITNLFVLIFRFRGKTFECDQVLLVFGSLSCEFALKLLDFLAVGFEQLNLSVGTPELGNSKLVRYFIECLLLLNNFLICDRVLLFKIYYFCFQSQNLLFIFCLSTATYIDWEVSFQFDCFGRPFYNVSKATCYALNNCFYAGDFFVIKVQLYLVFFNLL